MADAVANMYPSQRMYSEILEISSTSAARVDAYKVDLDTGGDGELSDIPPFKEIDIPLRLRADLTVIREMFVEHWVEAPTTAAGVLKLVLRSLKRTCWQVWISCMI